MTTIFDDNCPMIMEREFGLPEYVPQVAVGFCMELTEDKKQSAIAGHPVFTEREFCKIVIPGDKQSLYYQPATDEKRRKFPNAYQAFKQRETKPIVEGMPIEQWPQITRAQAMTFRAANIHTVEALAAVHDGNIDKIGNNMRELRAKAQAFLATAKDTAASQKLAVENQHLKDQMATMQNQINELAKALEKRGPGRPRKEESEAA
jgi:hypothetical protein